MADLVPVYDDEVGWVRVDSVLTRAEAAALRTSCQGLAAGTAFVFNRYLLHAGSRNESSSARPVLQMSFAAGEKAVSGVGRSQR